MYQDFRDLWSAFHAQSAQPRATKGLDLFIRPGPAIARAVYAALASFGAPLDNIDEQDLADLRQLIRFGREPVAVDILPGIDGLAFDAA